MDNCAIHHDEEIRRVIEGRGAKLIYLPPYSPDFNPIEQAFSFMKKHLRRHESEYLGPHTREWLIDCAIRAVTSAHAEGWARNCGYH